VSAGILARAGSATFETDPFPHIVIDDALDPALYEVLAAQFPPIDVVERRGRRIENNHLYLLSAAQALTHPKIAPEWKEFMRHHVSQEFWREALELLKPHLLAVHPGLEQLAGKPLEAFRVGMREKKHLAIDGDVSLDCQFGVNSPVLRESTVRSPHLDHPKKLFNALLYCRAPDDDTPGGDLILYRQTAPLAYAEGSSIMPTRVVEARRVAYRANRLVLFVTAPWSVHGVEPRPRTPHIRRYINFPCEFREPLFDLERLPVVRRYYELARATVAARLQNRGAAQAPRV
jgi:hypothetical protein